MKELRQVAETDPSYPDILFVYQGSLEDGANFFKRLWPETRAVSDPERKLYAAFGLERGGIRELFGPDVVACSIRAATKGILGGAPMGDTRMMPGAFLVQGNQILWQHTYRHIADHPDFAEIPALV